VGVGIGEGLYIVVIRLPRAGDLERARYESVVEKGISFWRRICVKGASSIAVGGGRGA